MDAVLTFVIIAAVCALTFGGATQPSVRRWVVPGAMAALGLVLIEEGWRRRGPVDAAVFAGVFIFGVAAVQWVGFSRSKEAGPSERLSAEVLQSAAWLYDRWPKWRSGTLELTHERIRFVDERGNKVLDAPLIDLDAVHFRSVLRLRLSLGQLRLSFGGRQYRFNFSPPYSSGGYLRGMYEGRLWKQGLRERRPGLDI